MNTLNYCFRILKKLCVWLILMPIMVQAADLPPAGIQLKSKEEIDTGIARQLEYLIPRNKDASGASLWYFYMVGEDHFDPALLTLHVQEELLAFKLSRTSGALKGATLIRRVDVLTRKNKISTFFEFKSVQPPLPPKKFADQFVKDLKITEVTSLDQLKWVFDGKKVSSLTKSDFMEVLENVNISDDVARKLVKTMDNPTTDDLLDLIEANFDEIFQVK